MNRKEEYLALRRELDEVPPALADTLTRARARLRARRRRFVALPAGGLAAAALLFVVLVNTSTSFAYACGQIPGLKSLAQFVALSPSLSAAVENAYVQPVEHEKTQDGITARVEYLIVDQKQLNIFFSMRAENGHITDVTPEVRASDGGRLSGYSLSSGSPLTENGELRQITVDFTENDMPDEMRLILKARDAGSGTAQAEAPARAADAPHETWKEPEYDTAFSFDLSFDPYFTATGETIVLEREITLDAQRLILKTAEVYPTHMRLNFEDQDGNTAWLKALDFYMIDERGKRFDPIANGITATGSTDSPMMASHRLESAYFAGAKELTLVITGVTCLDHDMQRVRVDLAHASAQALPEGVTLDSVERRGQSWTLRFRAQEQKENASYQLFLSTYYDEEGTEYSFSSWTSGARGYYDEEKGEWFETPGFFDTEFTLTDYPHDAVYLTPVYSRRVTLDVPVEIRIK